MVVDIDQRGDAIAAALSGILRRLLHSGAGKIPDRLGAVLVAVLLDHAIQFGHEIVIKGNGHALH